MTTIMLEGVLGLAFCLAMAVWSIWLYGRHCRDIGYEEGRADQYTAIGELAEMAELADLLPAIEPAGPVRGRHERTQPRTLPAVPTFTPAAQEQRPPWYTEIPGPAQLPAGGAIGIGRMLAAQTAREIPGPARIQPGRDSGEGTLTFPRVQLTDASTGEIRAIGDANVAAIEAAALP